MIGSDGGRPDSTPSPFTRHHAPVPEAPTALLDPAPSALQAVYDVRDLTFRYGRTIAIKDASLRIGRNEITAMIGPSGCGKSTFLRCLNRMNDLIPGTSHEGLIAFHGQDLYARDVDPVDVRRRIGMVFQKPNPFPKSIRDNLTFGMRVNGIKPTAERIEQGAMALGATRWQAVARQVVPAAFPGMLTGSILAMSRAIGEAAPLIVVGGVVFGTAIPSINPLEAGDTPLFAMPLQIFFWAGDARADFRELAAGGIVVLLGVLVLMNAVAIYLRNRYSRRW